MENKLKKLFVIFLIISWASFSFSGELSPQGESENPLLYELQLVAKSLGEVLDRGAHFVSIARLRYLKSITDDLVSDMESNQSLINRKLIRKTDSWIARFRFTEEFLKDIQSGINRQHIDQIQRSLVAIIELTEFDEAENGSLTLGPLTAVHQNSVEIINDHGVDQDLRSKLESLLPIISAGQALAQTGDGFDTLSYLHCEVYPKYKGIYTLLFKFLPDDYRTFEIIGNMEFIAAIADHPNPDSGNEFVECKATEVVTDK